MPNMWKITWPPRAKLVSTMKQVSAALRAMRLRRAASSCSVMARNDPIAANGSTRKKIELSASTQKCTHGAVRSSLNAVWAGLARSTRQDYRSADSGLLRNGEDVGSVRQPRRTAIM